MLASALILAFSGLGLPAQLGTVSSDDHTMEELLAYRPPSQRSPFERRFSLEARFGIGTPTGGFGVAAEVAFVPELGVGCGVGSNIYGAEYACWLRARPILGWDRAMTVSSGVSTAPFTQNDLTGGGVFGWGTAAMAAGRESDGPPDRDWAHAYWLNSDLGYESRKGAFVFRVFGGAAVLLNPSDGVVQPNSSVDADPPVAPLRVLLYAGVGMGFSE